MELCLLLNCRQSHLDHGLHPPPDFRRMLRFARASALSACAVDAQVIADKSHHDLLQALQRPCPDLVHPAGDVLMRGAEDVAEENVEETEVL